MVLLTTLFIWPWSIAFAQDLANEQENNRIRELKKTDEFNIRAALKKALDADDPEVTFHWHNPHTKHSGTIVTLSPIGQEDSGRICVDLVHVYYLGEASGGRHETTLCRDSSGNWNDTRIYTASAAPSHLQIYAEQTIFDVQNALTQLNYSPGSVDGVYGGRTRRAIEAFQRDKGLSVTGNINDELLVALKQAGIAFQGGQPVPTTEIDEADIRPSSPENTADSEPEIITTLEKAFSAESPVVIEAATTQTPKIGVSESASGETVTDGTTSAPKSSEPWSTEVESLDPRAAVDASGRIDESTLVAVTEPAATTSLSTDPLSTPGTAGSTAGKTATSSVDAIPKTSILREKVLAISEQLKKLVNMAESFDSHWFFISGFAICCLVGAFAAWFFTPKINHITLSGARLEPDEEELKAKIALVTSRLEQSPAPPTDWSYASLKPVSPPLTDTRETDDFEQPANTLEQQRDETAVSARNETDVTQAAVDKVAVNDPRVEPKLEKIPSTVDKNVEQQTAEKVPTPSQDATETIKQADEFIDIIEAIKEAEDLIKEAQEILKNDPMEGTSKDHITNAIKQATELIKEALHTGPIEGGSSKEITKALKNASVLIKQSLTSHIDNSSQLRVT